MDAHEIVQKLKTTPYKFTYAHKVRDEVKRMNDEDCDFIKSQIRRAMGQPENKDIVKPLSQILN